MNTLEIIQWTGGFCVYLNDIRIAGGKPYGGGTSVSKWKIKSDSVIEALTPKPKTTEGAE